MTAIMIYFLMMELMTEVFSGGSKSYCSGYFPLLAPKFWEVVGTYECYFVNLWLQVEWLGDSQVVGTQSHLTGAFVPHVHSCPLTIVTLVKFH